MPRIDDKVGLFWQAPPKRERSAAVFRPGPMPSSNWTAPTELPSLQGQKLISFDIETHDEDLLELGPGTRRGSYVAGLALGFVDGRRWYFPVRHQGGGNMDETRIKQWAKKELNAFDGEIVGAHILYDAEFMAMPEWGVTFPHIKGFHDVLLAEPLIDEWRPGFSLDSVAGYHLGETKRHELLFAAAAAQGWTSEKQVKSNLWRLPAAYVGPYGEGDADLPLRVLEKQLALIEKDKLNEVYDVERELIPLLLQMRLRGIPVNVARAESVNIRLVAEREKWLGEVRRHAGPRAELMAVDSFARALQDRGLAVPQTSKGKLSVTKPWLAMYAGKDALVDAILAGRRVDKIINTYTGQISKYAVNGRIYPQFPQLKGENGGTIARFSSSTPNVQNQPARDEELGPLTRSIFEPEAGEDWERQDASQIEFRLLVNFAALARDKQKRPLPGAEEARQAYINDPNTDFHALAATMCGMDPEDKVARKRVKNVNFCAVYMGGDDKLAATIGCSLAEASAFSRTYHARLPFVRQIGIIAMRRAQEEGVIRTVLGRRQRFTMYEPRNYSRGAKRDRKAQMMPYEEAVKMFGEHNIQRAFCHAGLNRGLQGSAADILKKGMRDIHKAGICRVLGAPLVTVHDELGLSVPRGSREADEAAAEARHLMENAVKLCLPVRVDWDRGENWGACK